MITTLRNNKQLLRGRKGFFKRELSFSEIREFYKESTDPINRKAVDQELLKKIREKLVRKQKRAALRRILFSFIVLGLLSIPTYLLFDLKFIEEPPAKQLKSVERLPSMYSKENFSNDMIILGLKNMKDGSYFLAKGNFEKSLEIHPDSMDIELLYAETICLLCEKNVSFCPEAIEVVKQLKKKYPKNYVLDYLEITYLKEE